MSMWNDSYQPEKLTFLEELAYFLWDVAMIYLTLIGILVLIVLFPIVALFTFD